MISAQGARVQDGWCPKARIGRQLVVAPVLATLVATAIGKCIIIDLRLSGGE
jgi:hypothetical protein